MERPLSFLTRRGNRVFRQPYGQPGNRSHSENYSFKVKRSGKQYYFSLGVDKKAAGKLADDIAAFLAVKTNSAAEAAIRFSPKPARPDPAAPHVPTVGAFCARYTESAGQLSSTTIKDNITALQRIAAFTIGLPVIARKRTARDLLVWRDLERFRASMLSSAGSDQLRKSRAVTTSNFYLRAASSMFAAKWAIYYADFAMPAPNPFREVRQLQEAPHRYVSNIDVDKLVQEARSELENSDPAGYLTFVLSLFCGMRRAEIDGLTWPQIDFENQHIWIRTTEQFRPKARNSENRIDAPSEVFDLLREFSARNLSRPFVLPGVDPKARPRCRPIYNRVLKWLRGKGVNHVQALHALRKEAGSLIFRKFGSVDVAAEFLRNDPRVAREHYIGRKGRLEIPIELDPGSRERA